MKIEYQKPPIECVPYATQMSPSHTIQSKITSLRYEGYRYITQIEVKDVNVILDHLAVTAKAIHRFADFSSPYHVVFVDLEDIYLMFSHTIAFVFTKMVSDEDTYDFLKSISTYMAFPDEKDQVSLRFFYKPDSWNIKNISPDEFVIDPNLYPNIDSTMLVEDYQASSESLLVLAGEPGVGKTTFIKLLLRQYLGDTVGYVNSEDILLADAFWHAVTFGEFHALVLDDINVDLLNRETEKGKKFLSHLLSYSDGLFEGRAKIIITTNQQLVTVDPALTRDGRCFDFIYLEPLMYEYALNLWTQWQYEERHFVDQFQGMSTVKQAELMKLRQHIDMQKYGKRYMKNEVDISRQFGLAAVGF